MYTDMKTILDDAVKHHYAVLAGGAFKIGRASCRERVLIQV